MYARAVRTGVLLINNYVYKVYLTGLDLVYPGVPRCIRLLSIVHAVPNPVNPVYDGNHLLYMGKRNYSTVAAIAARAH